MRKRILEALLSGFLVALFLSATSFATVAITEISGIVTSSGKPAAGAHVTVICDHNTKNTTADNTGTYLVQYGLSQCPNASAANVMATYEGESGSSEAAVNKVLTNKLNTALVKSSVIPTFGLITAGTASVLGCVGYIAIRSRETSGR
jgi:hypothetical protein